MIMSQRSKIGVRCAFSSHLVLDLLPKTGTFVPSSAGSYRVFIPSEKI